MAGKTESARGQAAKDLLVWLETKSVGYRDRSCFDRAADYATYRHLTSSVVRHRRKLFHLIETISARPVHKVDAEALVCLMLGLSQLESPQRRDRYAVVDETVELLVRFKRDRLKGFVNANLRGYLRNFERYEKAIRSQPLAVRTSHPDWMVDRWTSRFGEETARRICHANNVLPTVQIVPNPKYAERETANELKRRGYKLEKQPFGGYRVANPNGLFDTLPAQKGAFLVQDVSVQRIAKIVESFPKRDVLDACAAPGGKLFHLEWKYRDTIESLTALELSASRLKRLTQGKVRFGSRAKLLKMDATQPQLPGMYDLVLVDAPCSSTGTIRKHPEIKWNRQPQDFERNRERQLEILTGISPLVKKGGHILYSTCSLEREENQEVAETFLRRHGAEYEPCPIPERGLEKRLVTEEGHYQCLPSLDEMGAFAAAFRRKP